MKALRVPMSGQVAQLDPGSCRGGSLPSEIRAQALGGLKGPLMCEKKKEKKNRQKITGANFYAVKEQYKGVGAGLTRIVNGGGALFLSTALIRS